MHYYFVLATYRMKHHAEMLNYNTVSFCDSQLLSQSISRPKKMQLNRMSHCTAFIFLGFSIYTDIFPMFTILLTSGRTMLAHKVKIQPFALHRISDKPVLWLEQAQAPSGTVHSGVMMSRAVILKTSDNIKSTIRYLSHFHGIASPSVCAHLIICFLLLHVFNLPLHIL